MPVTSIMRGENLAYVKEQLGHSSIQVTVDLYGHLVSGMNKGAANALAEAMKCNAGATIEGWEVVDEAERADLLVDRVGVEPTAR